MNSIGGHKLFVRMKIVLIYEALETSSENKKGHFFTGILRELHERGHHVTVCTTGKDGALKDTPFCRDVKNFYSVFRISRAAADLTSEVADADLVIAESCIDKAILHAINAHVAEKRMLLLHDTDGFASRSSVDSIDNFHGILAGSSHIKDSYANSRFKHKVWLFEEAVDSRLFYPRRNKNDNQSNDVLFYANWNTSWSKDKIRELLVTTTKEAGISVTVAGGGYPEDLIRDFVDANVNYQGWTPYYLLPELMAMHRMSIHLGSKENREDNVLSMRFLESMACGIPLVSIQDPALNYFQKDKEFFYCENEQEWIHVADTILKYPVITQNIVGQGLRAVNRKHTCVHRVNDLESILDHLGIERKKLQIQNKFRLQRIEEDAEGYRNVGS